MLVVALNGSPRKNGNTFTLLNEAVQFAQREKNITTEWIHVSDALSGLKEPFCTYCSPKCEGACYRGTNLEEAYKLLARADAVLVGSPVYFGSVSGQLKAFWDKTRAMRKQKALLNTVGAVVTSGNAKYGGQEATLMAVIQMLLVHGMTIVGDGHKDFDCGHFGSCAQSPAEKDEFGRKRVLIAMKRLIEVAEATKELR